MIQLLASFISQFRISFERVHGGTFHRTLKINQLRLPGGSTNSVFIAFIVVTVAMLIEMKIIISKVIRRQWKSISLYCTVIFLVLNINLIFRSVQRYINLEHSIAAFELDPRSTPPFEIVFYHQYYLQSVIAIAQFCRIMYLMKILTSINNVKGETF